MPQTPRAERILGLVPARGGSKGISRKNVKLLGGKPLIAWTIEAALRSNWLDEVVVSTEDTEIGRIATELGASVPFVRPLALADDATPGIEPVLHALTELPAFDAVVLLQPTSPFRTTTDIDACIELALRSGAPAVVSVCEATTHPYWTFRVGADDRLLPFIESPLVARRQELPPAYALNGAIYYARTEWLHRHRAFITTETLAYVMPDDRSLDIDTADDWRLAEIRLAH